MTTDMTISVRPIRTAADHEAALAEIAGLMDAAPGSPEEDRLDVLATLVEAYEAKHYPMDPPDPVDAIRFRMEQQALAPKDLEPFLGSRARVSEVLNRRRPLSIAMIRALEAGLGIPASVLIRPGRGAVSAFHGAKPAKRSKPAKKPTKKPTKARPAQGARASTSAPPRGDAAASPRARGRAARRA
jgi:HTH-type transcriptional regulator/antitoxin HigA